MQCSRKLKNEKLSQKKKSISVQITLNFRCLFSNYLLWMFYKWKQARQMKQESLNGKKEIKQNIFVFDHHQKDLILENFPIQQIEL